MIVDSPFLGALATGADRVIPQEGDAQVLIPSAITPVISATTILEPYAVAGAGTELSGSGLVTFNITRTNLAAIVQNVTFLVKGYWELSISLALRSNWLPVGSVGDVITRLTNNAGTQSNSFHTVFANIGVQNHTFEKVFLLAERSRVDVRIGATGAAQTFELDFCLLARRLL